MNKSHAFLKKIVFYLLCTAIVTATQAQMPWSKLCEKYPDVVQKLRSVLAKKSLPQETISQRLMEYAAAAYYWQNAMTTLGSTSPRSPFRQRLMEFVDETPYAGLPQLLDTITEQCARGKLPHAEAYEKLNGFKRLILEKQTTLDSR